MDFDIFKKFETEWNYYLAQSNFQFCYFPDDDSTNNYAEEQMEFVPSDFLEQGDIADETDSRANSSSMPFSDEESKHDNEDTDRSTKEQSPGKKESRPSRTKKDKT